MITKPPLTTPVHSVPIVGYNYGNNPAQTDEDLTKLTRPRGPSNQRPFSIAGQETRDRQERIDRWLATQNDYARVELDVDAPGSDDLTTIYLKEALELLDAYAVPVAGRTRVGDKKKHEGSGPPVINPKATVVITYRELQTRRILTHINFHQIASWTRSVDYLGLREWEDRRDYGSHHIQVVCNRIDRIKKGLIVVTCDLNAKNDFELVQPLADRVDLSQSKRIDFAAWADHRALADSVTEVLSGFSSDHPGPVLTTALIHERPGKKR